MNKSVFCLLKKLSQAGHEGEEYIGTAFVQVATSDLAPWNGEGTVSHIGHGRFRYLPSERELGFPSVSYLFYADGVLSKEVTVTQRIGLKTMSLTPADVTALTAAIHALKNSDKGAELSALLAMDPGKVDVKGPLFLYLSDPANPGGGNANLPVVSQPTFFEMLTQSALRIASKSADVQLTYNNVISGLTHVNSVKVDDTEIQAFFTFLTSNGLLDNDRKLAYTTSPISLIQVALGINASITEDDLASVVWSATGVMQI